MQFGGGCSPDLLLRLVGPRRGQGTSPGRGGYRTRAPRSWAARRPRAQGLPWSGRPRALAHAAGLDRELAGTGGGPARLCQLCESGAWTRGAGLLATAPARLRRRRGLARSWPRGGINPRGRGARLGDYGAPPRRIYSRGDGDGGREEWRRRGARRAAGVPGGPAPSPSSTSSPAYPRAAPRPGSPARRRPPAARAPRSRGSLRRPRPCPAPAAAAAAPARRPAGPRSRPLAWVSGHGARELRDPGRRRGVRSPAPGPRLTEPSSRRRATTVAAEAGARGALALGRTHRGLRGAARRGRSWFTAAHAAPPHHLQRGAAAGAGSALRAKPVPRRGHSRAPGRPHSLARRARGGGCLQPWKSRPRVAGGGAQAPGKQGRRVGPWQRRLGMAREEGRGLEQRSGSFSFP